jgi:ClpP class serine protease
VPNTHAVTVRDGVALIPVYGPIFPKANLMTEFCGATSLESVVQDLVTASEDPNIEGIVLLCDTPGGQATGLHEASTLLRSIQKPTVAYVEGQCASAGYYFASGARKIVMPNDARVGSIGTVLGVRRKSPNDPVEIVSSQSPDKRPDHATDEGRAVLQRYVDDLTQVFIETVAQHRGLTPDHVQTSRGGMLVGQKAVDFGLADALGSLDSVIAELSKPTPSTMTSATGKNGNSRMYFSEPRPVRAGWEQEAASISINQQNKGKLLGDAGWSEAFRLVSQNHTAPASEDRPSDSKSESGKSDESNKDNEGDWDKAFRNAGNRHS